MRKGSILEERKGDMITGLTPNNVQRLSHRIKVERRTSLSFSLGLPPTDPSAYLLVLQQDIGTNWFSTGSHIASRMISHYSRDVEPSGRASGELLS